MKMRVQDGEPGLTNRFSQLTLNKSRTGNFRAAVFQLNGKMRDFDFHGFASIRGSWSVEQMVLDDYLVPGG
jgi:hypothetical protein